MKKLKWLIVYYRDEIYSSILIDIEKYDVLKKRFIEELNYDKSVKFELVDKEPFHGW